SRRFCFLFPSTWKVFYYFFHISSISFVLSVRKCYKAPTTLAIGHHPPVGAVALGGPLAWVY
ncbi:MAG: hypothetical protein FWC62_05750, partial [Firmicutes bacterium]|nr:hypothetical protein [Bacillota bacterium]